MDAASRIPSLVRFAGFELQTGTGELRSAGELLHLAPQPTRLLTYLVLHHGRLITREELRQQLWTEGTFVDFDQGLNFCVRQIRTALHEDADHPRYIETLPRRGYRFIAAVEAASPDRVEAARQVPAPTQVTPPRPGRSSTLRFLEANRLAIGIALLLVVASLTWIGAGLQNEPPGVVRVVPITNDGIPKLGNSPHDFMTPIVSDGPRLYFQEQLSGRSVIAQVSTGGGGSEILRLPFPDARLADIAPDGASLLVASVSSPTTNILPIYNVPVIGGSASRVGNLNAHDASWSPDGSRLIFANDRDLFVANKDGSNPQSLVHAEGLVWWPRWSPDGSRIRFTLNDSATHTNSLWQVKADGAHLEKLFSDSPQVDECCGSWSRDGRLFVFQSARGGLPGIWALNERLSIFHLRSSADAVQLTRGPMSAFAPLPSASADRIYTVGVQPRSELLEYDRGKAALDTLLPGLSASQLEYTTDGQWILYVQYPEGTLWRARSDGSDRIQLTQPPLKVSFAHWSPDGTRVALWGASSDGVSRVYLLPANGGLPEPLLVESADQASPSWFPDGERIAFGRAPWKNAAKASALIYVYDLRSRQLTTLPDSDGLFAPHCSPDGKALLAIKTDSTGFLLFDFATQRWRTLISASAIGYPNWSSDGKYIYAKRLEGSGSSSVIRIRVADGAVEPIVNLNGQHELPFEWIGLTADDRPIVTRETGTQEIYALELTRNRNNTLATRK